MLWVVYATLLVPIVGLGLLIVWSSVVYYLWRRRFPEAAARANRHAWVANRAIAASAGSTAAASFARPRHCLRSPRGGGGRGRATLGECLQTMTVRRAD